MDLGLFFKKYKLLFYIFGSISLAIIIGLSHPSIVLVEFFTLVSKFSSTTINFFVPFMIFAFVTQGIISIDQTSGGKAKASGKILGLVVCISYLFMLIAAIFTCIFCVWFFSNNFKNNTSFVLEEAVKGSFFNNLPKIKLKPFFGVIPAIVVSFVLGIGANIKKTSVIKQLVSEFKEIISDLVGKLIVIILPIYVFGTFLELTFSGKIVLLAMNFYKVFIIEISSHLIWLIFQFSIASIFAKKNPFELLGNIKSLYLTAFAIRSSVASIPASLDSAEKNGVSDEVANFVVPICSTIHLTGSIISITTSMIATMVFFGFNVNFFSLLPFILMLSFLMIAAPGVPCGVILTVSSTLVSILNFTPSMISLMVALHVFQDGFGTACNVCGDNAIAIITDKFYKKINKI